MIEALSPRLDRLLMQAAVSGRFDPMTLLSGEVEQDAVALAGGISVYCDEAPCESGLHWILKPAVRRQLLARLDRRISVEAALEGAPEPVAGDHFAVALRELLRGAPSRTARRQRQDPAVEAARHSALQFSSFAPVVDSAARSIAFDASRVRIAEAQKEAALGIVLPHCLFGRAPELARIRRFIRKQVDDARPLLVLGVGGIGKSALVAATIRSWTRSGNAAILLDFDRPDLATGNPLPLAREFARQLETIWLGNNKETVRQAGHVIADIRGRIRSYELETGERSTADDQFSFVFSSMVAILGTDVPADARTEPLLLVLDSFEVIGMRGPDVAQRVIDLINYFQIELPGMRTIVSGRECPVPEEAGVTADGRSYRSAEETFGPVERRLRVSGLSPSAGGDLLARHDRNRRFGDASVREQAVKALGGNPLALLVLERFARDKPREEIDELVADLESNEEFSAEFAQSFLYSRILERIRDTEVSALAHPGLVLRRVTPNLIRLVLAGPCGLGAVDPVRAKAMFGKLAGEYWLVERQGPDLVRHRPDLRRLMLPGLFARPADRDSESQAARKRELRINTIAVCQAAAAFYADGPPAADPAHSEWAVLGERERAAEVTYYSALGGTTAPAALDPAEAGGLRDYLGADFETLPIVWRAVARASLGDFSHLSVSERSTLSGALREQADLAFAEASLKAGHSSRAAKSARRARQASGPEASADSRLRRYEHEISAAFADAEFFAAAKPAVELLDAFDSGAATAATRSEIERGRLWATPVWEGLLAFTAAGSIAGSGNVRLSPRSAKSGAGSSWQSAAAPLIEALEMARPPEHLRFEPSWSRSIDGLRRTALLERRDGPGSAVRPEMYRIDSTALALADPEVMRFLMSSSGSAADMHYPASQAFADFALQLDRKHFTLGDLERAYSRPAEVPVSGMVFRPRKAERMGRMFRGLTPELYPPAMRLFAAIPEGLAIALANRIALNCALWPDDLWFVLPGGMEVDGPPQAERRPFDPRLALAVFQTADRCGGLSVALELLHQHSRPARWLVIMHDLISSRIFGGEKIQ